MVWRGSGASARFDCGAQMIAVMAIALVGFGMLSGNAKLCLIGAALALGYIVRDQRSSRVRSNH